MVEIMSSLKKIIGNERYLFGVINLRPGVIKAMWWSQKVVPMRTFGGKLCITRT